MANKYPKRSDFIESQEGKAFKETLRSITQDPAYNTSPSYSANSDLYPDNLMPFIDKHMNYIIAHPALDPAKYLANIRLITRIR